MLELSLLWFGRVSPAASVLQRKQAARVALKGGPKLSGAVTRPGASAVETLLL